MDKHNCVWFISRKWINLRENLRNEKAKIKEIVYKLIITLLNISNIYPY